MRKISTLLMLFCAFVGTAWAQTSLRISDGLLATQENTQYKWTSAKLSAPTEGEFNKIRVTFLKTSNNEKPAGFPCVAIAEFYLYDKDGNAVTLTETDFSSNATQGNEGKISALCNGAISKQDGEGDYDWYWHSQWSGTPNPYGYHYLELDLTNVNKENLSEYQIGWVTRRAQASPAEIVISTGATTAEAAKNANTQMLPQVSTDIAKFYTVKSVRSKKYLAYNGDDVKPTQVSALNDSCYWYFAKGSDDKVIVKNAATNKVLGTEFKMASEGEWFVSPAGYRPGVVFSKTGNVTQNNCIDDQSGSIGSWSHNAGDEEGTTWMTEEVVNAPVEVPALTIQGLKIASIGEAVKELEVDKWYILNNVGRGNIVSQEGNNWKVRAKNSVAVGDYANDKAGYLFKVTKNGEYYNIYSGNGKYFQLGQNTASTSATPVNYEIGKIGESTDVFYLFDKDHGYAADGQETNNGFVGWATSHPTSAGGNDSYKLLPVELVKNIYEVTYNFVYEGVVKASTTKSIAEGEDYPAVEVPVLPYGVTVVNATKPEGSVTGNHTEVFTLTVEHELPFKTATDVNNITTWYYAQMHANAKVTAYVEDNENENNNVEWADKTVAADEINSHLWGFVGDIWTGIKMVNKGTGRAIVSTSGDAVMGDAASATAFVPVYSNAAYRDGWFCLKYPNSADHLNAQNGKISSWWDDDNGSSFFLTEYKETEVEVSAADYATLYLGQATYIPEDVEVYAVTGLEGGWVTMTAVEGVLPANTGVILKNQGTYTFKTAGATGSVEGNLLLGSVENTYVEGAAYVLGKDAQGAGFFKAKLNKNAEGSEGNTHFLNNANKAYLPVPVEEEEPAQALRFNFGGTTAIESVVNGINANAAIYDLSGRCVEKATKGIYIVNGKKMIVK